MRGRVQVPDLTDVSELKKNNNKSKMMSQMIRFIILILVVLLLFTFIIPNYNYIRIANLNNILTDAVIPAIFGFAMGIILAGSGFDLSLGHIASMVASIVAYLMSRGLDVHPVLAVLIGLSVAAIVGSISGILVSRMGISSFIVTLGIQFLVIGARQLITRGQSVYINNEGFKWLARRPLGISNLVFILIIVAFLCYLLMEKSAFGRKVHFVGSNIETSRFSGIDVRLITFSIFVLGAVLAAFGGILFAARAGAVQINSVDFRLLDAITIAVFSSVLFGRFRTAGIILVAILISMIATGLSMLGIQTEWIEFVKGFILLSAIVMSKFNNEDRMIKRILINHHKKLKEN
jgi:ribose/xylose/arabinose/galactoside ABC-type transport system permease subunit